MCSEIKLALAGDFMPGRLLNYDSDVLSSTANLTVSTRGVEDVVHEFMRDASFRMCNLEGCFSDTELPLQHLLGDPEEHIGKHLISLDGIKTLELFDINCVSLANNHILDDGKKSVRNTVGILNRSNIKWAGFGSNYLSAWKPRIFTLDVLKANDPTQMQTNGCHCENPSTECRKLPQIKIAVYSLADHLKEWRATENSYGINYFDIENFSLEEGNPNWDKWTNFENARDQIKKVKKQVDMVLFSIHWGDNFSWEPPEAFISFAHLLIDSGVQIVFGHSSHHIQGIEYYHGGVIIYGSGDFLNDYDLYDDLLKNAGSTLGNEFKTFRSNLSFIYKFCVRHECENASNEAPGIPYWQQSSWKVNRLELLPIKIDSGHIVRPNEEETSWLTSKIDELSSRLGELQFVPSNDCLVVNLNCA